jgi:serine/threonine protein kinase
MQVFGKIIAKIVTNADADRYKRAKREMHLLQMFNKHQSICNIMHGAAQDAVNGSSARCVFILQCYEHGTVETLLKSGNPEFTHRSNDAATPCLRFECTLAMAKDVLEGLECMHQMNIVHRDIKPSNICIEFSESSAQLRFIIIDLGAAIGIESQSIPSPAAETGFGFTGMYTDVAGTKLPLGTVLFMSPEHIDQYRAVDGRTDIFSLGVTMYQCMSGRFPFLQRNPLYDNQRLAHELRQKYANPLADAAPLTLRSITAHRRAQKEVCAVVAKSLRKPAGERFQSATAMKKRLESVSRCWGVAYFDTCTDVRVYVLSHLLNRNRRARRTCV